tara:strand:- start:2084 stop:2605 length:522 start_codon:yes stop_codon:yes gene_type:complete
MDPKLYAMKKILPIVMLLMTASAAQAGGLVSKQSSSVQLTVEAARSTAVRVGNSYSISGTNVGTSDGTTAGVLSTGTVTAGVYSPGTISASQLSATNGESFSFATSFTQGDAIPSSAATTGDIPNFSNVTSYTAGVAGSLAGTVNTSGALTVTAGGAGTTATGQFVSEITVID